MKPERSSAAWVYRFSFAAFIASCTLLLGASPARAATYTVTKTADTISGSCAPSNCSLRDAVIAANASPGKDTIVVPEGTYELTIPGVGENASVTGDLDLTDDVEIQGVSWEKTNIYGHDIDRVLHVLPGVTAGLTDLDAWGGGNPYDYSQSSLGGVYVQQSTLNLTRCRVSHHPMGLWLDQGEVTATDSSVAHNCWAGIGITGGTLTLTNSTVSYTGSWSPGFPSAIGIDADSATIVLRNSAVTGNSGTSLRGSGGYGITLYGSSSLLLDTSTVCWNGGYLDGLGLAVDGGSTANIVDSTICENSSRNLISAGDVSITNSTIDVGQWYSGASLVNYGQMTLRNSTVTSPETDWTSAIANQGQLTFANTLIEGGCVISGGTLQTDGGNLESPGKTCGLTDPSDQASVLGPVTSPLADNGGPTLTRALLPRSAAIDKALEAHCPATDQRGISRPKGAACDIGAYELDPDVCSALTTAHTGQGANPVVAPGNSTGCPAGQYHPGESIQLTASPATGWLMGGWSGTDDDVSTSTTNTLTMPPSARTVSAKYVEPCYALTISHTGSGRDPDASPGNSTDCSAGQYHAGEWIQLGARPASGWTVGSWSGTDDDSSAQSSNTVTMPAGAHSASVGYVPVCYALIRNHTGSGGHPAAVPVRSVGCPADSYHAGESIQVTASPAAGWGVGSWGGTTNNSSTSTTNTVTMPASSHGVWALYVQQPGLWAGATDLGGGWRSLDWLGVFFVVSDPWIYHQQLGWLHVSGTSTADLWIYCRKMASWLWTSDTLFPFLYRTTGPTPAWLYYLEWTTSPAWFHNQTTGEWESY